MLKNVPQVPANNMQFDLYKTNCEHGHQAKKVGVATKQKKVLN